MSMPLVPAIRRQEQVDFSDVEAILVPRVNVYPTMAIMLDPISKPKCNK